MNGKVLVVGYGNPLRGDDGAGPAVAAAFAEMNLDETEVITCHQLTPELAQCIAGVDLVVFVDAHLGGTPGHVAITPLEAEVAVKGTTLVHHVGPAALVSLSTELFGRTPQAFLVTVSGRSFELEESLSEIVTTALPRALEAIRRLIAETLHDD